MALKTELLQVKMTEKALDHIKKCAKDQDRKIPEYVNDALDFFGAFDVHFLEHIHSTAKKIGQNMPTVIENLLQAYMSIDIANSEVFKVGGHTYRQAFQYDENGLIRGNKLSDKVYEDHKKVAKTLLDKLAMAAREKKEVFVSHEDAAILASVLMAGKDPRQMEMWE